MKSPDAPIDFSEHALDILEEAVALIETDQRFALVTSLSIEGGAARAVGSLALVRSDGSMKGYLSNGCIDRDIILQGLASLETGVYQYIRYGAGSPFLDLTLPCGGALELVIDPSPSEAVLRKARDALQLRNVAQLSFTVTSGLVDDPDSSDALTFEYAPKPALVLAGRGAILRMTAKLAMQMDFDVHVASPDIEDLEYVRVLGPIHLHPMTTPDQPLNIPIDNHTAVLLLFHDHDWEQEVLMSVTQNSPFFVGAMGSRRTHSLRLLGLASRGMDPRVLSSIRGPVGLVPSLRNASLIAVSALADVVSEMPVSQYQTHPKLARAIG